MKKDKELAYRYIFGELNETQFRWWIVKEGLNEEAMYALVEELRVNFRRSMIQLTIGVVFFVLGLILFLLSMYL